MDSLIKRKILGWKAWYADGSVYSSLTCKWEHTPKSGLQILKKFYYQYEVGKESFEKRANGEDRIFTEIQSGADVYCVDDLLIDETQPSYIKRGTYIDQYEYKDIFNNATKDTDVVISRV